MMRKHGVARLMIVPAILCLLLALPVVLPIPTLWGWKLTLIVTELGHWLALLALIVTLIGWHLHGAFRAITILPAAAVILFLIPTGMAWVISHSLSAKLQKAFGPSAVSAESPLSLGTLFFGRPPKSISSRVIFYAEEGTEKRSLFLYTAPADRPVPCLIMIHSGGWENGRPEEFPTWSHHWVSKGYAVASIQYRLAPTWQWPAQQEDVEAAIKYLKAHADELGIDPTRFILIGRSAGGQIATACASNLKDPAIKGCVSLYAPADMPFARKFADPKDVLDSLRLLRQYLGGDPENVGEQYRSASATLTAGPDFPPTLIVHGKRDTLVWHLQSQRLAARLEEMKVPHHYIELPWGTHALDFPFQGPSSQLTRYAMGAFFQSVLR